MESYIDKNPKKFGYSDPNGGSSGNAFIQRALVYINGDYDYRTDKIDEAQIANWKKTWDWFSSKKDALIRTASNADSLTRLNEWLSSDCLCMARSLVQLAKTRCNY